MPDEKFEVKETLSCPHCGKPVMLAIVEKPVDTHPMPHEDIKKAKAGGSIFGDPVVIIE